MKLIVTDSYTDLKHKTNIFVITTMNNIEEKCKKKNIKVKLADEIGGVSSEEVTMELEKINQCMLYEIGRDDRLAMLWEIVNNCSEGTSGMIEEILTVIKNLIFLVDMEFDSAEIHYCQSNKKVCDVTKSILRQKGILVRIHFNSFTDRIRYYFSHENRFLKPKTLDIRNVWDLLKYVKYIKKSKNKVKKQYSVGVALCSNDIRQYEWLQDYIDELKEFDSYKILCIRCEKMYKKLIENEIEADFMEEWLTWKVVKEKFKEYFHIRRKARRNIMNLYSFSYSGLDFSHIIKNQMMFYLYNDMMLKYFFNMICASYFNSNFYTYITPWGDSSFYETRIFYINAKKAKFYRNYGFQLYKTVYEKWPDIFDVLFFSQIGLDLKKKYDKQYWGNERYYVALEEEGLYKRWMLKEPVNSRDVPHKFMILYAPSATTRNIRRLSDVVEKARILLEFLKDKRVEFVCKFHPIDRGCDLVEGLVREYSGYKSIIFPGVTESIRGYIQCANVVITDTSTVILDGIVERKPVICYLSKWEFGLIEYLSDKIVMYQSEEDLFECLTALWSDVNFYQNWYTERIQKQDKLFEAKANGVRPWQKLREKI